MPKASSTAGSAAGSATGSASESTAQGSNSGSTGTSGASGRTFGSDLVTTPEASASGSGTPFTPFKEPEGRQAHYQFPLQSPLSQEVPVDPSPPSSPEDLPEGAASDHVYNLPHTSASDVLKLSAGRQRTRTPSSGPSNQKSPGGLGASPPANDARRARRPSPQPTHPNRDEPPATAVSAESVVSEVTVRGVDIGSDREAMLGETGYSQGRAGAADDRVAADVSNQPGSGASGAAHRTDRSGSATLPSAMHSAGSRKGSLEKDGSTGVPAKVSFGDLPSPPSGHVSKMTSVMYSPGLSPSRQMSGASSFFPSQPRLTRRSSNSRAANAQAQARSNAAAQVQALMQGEQPRSPGGTVMGSPTTLQRLLVHRDDVTGEDILNSIMGPLSASGVSSFSAGSLFGGRQTPSPRFAAERGGSGQSGEEGAMSPTAQPAGSGRELGQAPAQASHAHHHLSRSSSHHDYPIPQQERLSFGQALADRDSGMDLPKLGPPKRRPSKIQVTPSGLETSVPTGISVPGGHQAATTPAGAHLAQQRKEIQGLGIIAPTEVLPLGPAGDVLPEDTAKQDTLVSGGSPSLERKKSIQRPAHPHRSSWENAVLRQPSSRPILDEELQRGARFEEVHEPREHENRHQRRASNGWSWASSRRVEIAEQPLFTDQNNPIDAAFGEATRRGDLEGGHTVPKAVIDELATSPGGHHGARPAPVSPSTFTGSGTTSRGSTNRFKSYTGPALPEIESTASRADLFYLAFGDKGSSGREAFKAGAKREKRKNSIKAGSDTSSQVAGEPPISEPRPVRPALSEVGTERSAATARQGSAPDDGIVRPVSTSSDAAETTSTRASLSTDDLPEAIKEERLRAERKEAARAAKAKRAADKERARKAAGEKPSAEGPAPSDSKSRSKSGSKSGSGSSGIRRPRRTEQEITAAVIMPVRETAIIPISRPPSSIAGTESSIPTSETSSDSPGDSGAYPRVQNKGSLRPHGTFTTSRQASADLLKEAARIRLSATMLQDDRFDSISEDQLAMAAKAGDQIAAAHLHQRHRRDKRGVSSGDFDRLPEIGASAEELDPLEPLGQVRQRPRVRMPARSGSTRSITLPSFDAGMSSTRTRSSIDSLDSDFNVREPTSSSVQGTAGTSARRKSSGGSSINTYGTDLTRNSAGSTSPSVAGPPVSSSLQTIDENARVDVTTDALPSLMRKTSLKEPGDAPAGEESRRSSGSLASGPASLVNATEVSTALDLLLDKSSVAGSQLQSTIGQERRKSEADKAAGRGEQGNLLRITDDPFTTDMSLLPQKRLSEANVAELAKLRKEAESAAGGSGWAPRLDSELFNDVARLTSLDLRKTLAREAKELRTHREGPELTTSRRSAAIHGPGGTVLVAGETKEQRRARRERRRQERAQQQHEERWAREVAERQAIAPSDTVEDKATPSRTEVVKALKQMHTAEPTVRKHDFA